MLSTVRLARGLTQSALAKKSGLSQATISKVEGGALEIDDDRWAALAAALDAPKSMLRLPVIEAGSQTVVFHRKRSSLPVSVGTRIRAQLDLVHLQLSRLLAESAPVRVERIPLPPDGWVTPEEVAQRVRRDLGVPAGPVEDLVGVLESAGVAVMRTDLGSAKIDALMSWPPGRRPVVLLGSSAPGDRQRFSVAHEMGHAVMHQVPSETQEIEADKFAAEFLMPRTDIAAELKDVTVPKLAHLKSHWGVSMSALLRRARDLAQISEATYKRLNIELSTAGFRTREPVEIPVENPTLITSRVQELLRSGSTPRDLAEVALMTENNFIETYVEDAA